MENIDQYIAKTLTIDQKEQFEQEMNENPELADQVSKQLLATEAIKLAGLRASVAAVQKEFLAEEKSQKPIQPLIAKPQNNWFISFRNIAASLAVLVLGWSTYQYFNLNSQSILEENTISYHVPVMRSTEQVENKFVEYYKNGEFDKVLKLNELEKIQTQKEQFITAMANFNLKNYDSALNQINGLINQKDLRENRQYSNELHYYKALCLIGLNKTNEGISEFKKISANPDNPYAKSISNLFLMKLKILALKN